METERLEVIKTMLLEQSTVHVDKLAAHFQVSPMTIRRDLKKLSEENPSIHRCHGGAVLVTGVSFEETTTEKSSRNSIKKKQIAARALSLIKPNQLIYIDAGTSCHELARLIVDRAFPVDVVTNDLRTASLLGENGYRVIMPGGTYEKETGCLIGSFSESTISMLRFDVAFIGATSIDEQFEVSTPTQEKTFMKRHVISRADQSYLLVDSTKFFRRSRYTMYPLNIFDGVITDKEFNPSEVELLDGMNAAIIHVRYQKVSL